MGRGTKKELLLYLLSCSSFLKFLSKYDIVINIPTTQNANAILLFSVIYPFFKIKKPRIHVSRYFLHKKLEGKHPNSLN